MSVVNSHELSYTSEIANHSSSRMSKVLPLNGQSVTLLAGNSTSEVQIELPNKCYNLARSTLDFKVSVPLTSSVVNRLHTLGQSFINRITLATREGVSLMDLRECDKYTRAVAPVATRLSDLQCKPNAVGSLTDLIAGTKGKGHFVAMSNTLATATPAAGHSVNGTRIAAGGATPEAPDISYTEFQYTTQSTSAGAMFLNASIPLNELYHSICSVDRVMYFGQSLLMTVYFNGLGKIGFGTALIGDYANQTAIASAVVVSDIKLYVAVETNPVIISGLVQQVQSNGLQMIVPYVYGYKFVSPSGSSSSVQQRLNAGHGQRLLNVYHAVYHATDSGSTAMDLSNVSAAKVVSFQTSLDNQYLQEFIPSCALSEDYEILQPILKGSCAQSNNVYAYNKVWVDSWRKGRTCDWRDTDTVIDGLPLESERIWTIEQTTHATPASYQQYSWFNVQRTLSIDASGLISMQ